MQEYNTDNYVFFFGSYLSNFYSAPFIVDKTKYFCSEQYFMKKKQEMFDPDNKEIAEKMMTETSPKKIKILGRKVKNFDEEAWGKARYDIMKTGVLAKFSQNNDIKDLLIATGDKIIAEASPFDKIWGIGISVEKAKITHPNQWKGQNLLGKILMEVRKEIK